MRLYFPLAGLLALSIFAGELPTPEALIEGIKKGENAGITALETARPDLSRYNAALARELTTLLENTKDDNAANLCLQAVAAVGESANAELAAVTARFLYQEKLNNGTNRDAAKALLAMGPLGRTEIKKAIPLCVTKDSVQAMNHLARSQKGESLKEFLPDFLTLYKNNPGHEVAIHNFKLALANAGSAGAPLWAALVDAARAEKDPAKCEELWDAVLAHVVDLGSYKKDLLERLAMPRVKDRDVAPVYLALLRVGANDPAVIAAVRAFLAKADGDEIDTVAVWGGYYSEPAFLALVEDIARGKAESKSSYREHARSSALVSLARNKHPAAVELLPEFLASRNPLHRGAALEAAFFIKGKEAEVQKIAAAWLAEAPKISDLQGLSFSSADGIRETHIWARAILALEPKERPTRLKELIQLFPSASHEVGEALIALTPDQAVIQNLRALLNNDPGERLRIDVHCILAGLKSKLEAYPHLHEIDQLLHGESTLPMSKRGHAKSNVLRWCTICPELRKARLKFLTDIARNDPFWLDRWTADIALEQLRRDSKK